MYTFGDYIIGSNLETVLTFLDTAFIINVRHTVLMGQCFWKKYFLRLLGLYENGVATKHVYIYVVIKQSDNAVVAEWQTR